MQATDAPTQVSPQQLAEEIAHFWRRLVSGNTAALYAVIEELDLSFTQMKALHALSEMEAEVTVKELSDELGLSLPATSRTVDSLLRRGWAERREDTVDRRMKRVRITDAGADVVDRVDSARLAGLARYTASLSPDQRARLSAALSDLPDRT